MNEPHTQPARQHIRKSAPWLAAAMLAFGLPAHAQTYNFYDLGTLGGSSSVAIGINNAGQVVGSSLIAGDRHNHATVWNTDMMPVDMGTLAGGADSYGYDINNAGQVAGGSTVSTSNFTMPVWWSAPGSAIGLPGAENVGGYALSISDSGQIVGYTNLTSANGLATSWSGNQYTYLSGNCESSIAYRVNSAGIIAGVCGYQAAVWSGGTLDKIGLNNSGAYDVNESGLVLGSGVAINGHIPRNPGPFIWDGTKATYWPGSALIALPVASRMNAAGDAVGSGLPLKNSTTRFAVGWIAGKVINLNKHLANPPASGWSLTAANAINDNGWIVGVVANSQTGVEHAYLLKPKTAQ